MLDYRSAIPTLLGTVLYPLPASTFEWDIRIRSLEGSLPSLPWSWIKMCCFKDFKLPNSQLKKPLPTGFHGTNGFPIHGWLIFIVNVGKYTSPMDPMGYDLVAFGKTFDFWLLTKGNFWKHRCFDKNPGFLFKTMHEKCTDYSTKRQVDQTMMFKP